jgi:hypothetical protein
MLHSTLINYEPQSAQAFVAANKAHARIFGGLPPAVPDIGGNAAGCNIWHRPWNGRGKFGMMKTKNFTKHR